MSRLLRIATRKSPLALWQAEHVGQLLKSLEPKLSIELVKLSTQGDKILDQALSKVGGKDLFVKEIENALLRDEADIAVHSLKDVPTQLPTELCIAAYPPREDPRDVLILAESLKAASSRSQQQALSPRQQTLPQDAVIGTCSLRRAAQLLHLRPDLQIVPIRGNVQTRLQRMQNEGMAGTLLAYSGLIRLGLSSLASKIYDESEMLPAIAQGILAVEARADDVEILALCARMDDGTSRQMATAERSFLSRLEGGCQVPIAGNAKVKNGQIHLHGLIASLDGRRVVRGENQGAVDEAHQVGQNLAEQLLKAGGKEILDELR